MRTGIFDSRLDLCKLRTDYNTDFTVSKPFQTDLCNSPCLTLSHSFSVFLGNQEYWFSCVNPLTAYPCVFNWSLFHNKISICLPTSLYIQYSACASLAEVLIASLRPLSTPAVVHDNSSLTGANNWTSYLSSSYIRQRWKNGKICRDFNTTGILGAQSQNLDLQKSVSSHLTVDIPNVFLPIYDSRSFSTPRYLQAVWNVGLQRYCVGKASIPVGENPPSQVISWDLSSWTLGKAKTALRVLP